MKKGRIRATGAIIGALALVAAGCGSDTTDEGTSATATADDDTAETTEAMASETTAAMTDSTATAEDTKAENGDAAALLTDVVPDGAGDGLTIGFVPGITSDPFFRAMQIGAEESAAKLGIELIWQGAPDEYSPESQLPFVESMISQGVDGIVLVPTDPDALQPSVEKATAASIPVITVDTTVTDQSELVAHITGDNVEGGLLAARTLAEQIGGSGEVFLMKGSPTATTNTLREEGFLKGLAEFPDIELVGTEYANSQSAQATSAINNVLLQYPNLKGIYAVDGTSGLGTVAALRNNGKVGSVKLVGYDAYSEQVTDLEDGAYSALVAQQPRAMADLALEYMVAHLTETNAEAIQPEVVMPNVVLTADNLADNQSVIYPS